MVNPNTRPPYSPIVAWIWGRLEAADKWMTGPRWVVAFIATLFIICAIVYDRTN